MDKTQLASGDISSADIQNVNDIIEKGISLHIDGLHNNLENEFMVNEIKMKNDVQSKINSETLDDNEIKLKERIRQCKNIIESLKCELKEEKYRLENEAKVSPSLSKGSTENDDKFCIENYNFTPFKQTSFTNIEKRLGCDENLLEYEKQLEKYQNTLNMAKIEKKNAIRRQMLAKAYKLKLLEVENQCNIELLRVKQSLQCLQPLKAMVKKWKITSKDEIGYNFNEEILPPYPALNSNPIVEMNTAPNNGNITFEKSNSDNDDSKSSDCS